MKSYLKYILFCASFFFSAFLIHSCTDNYEDGSYAEEKSYALTTTNQIYNVNADAQTVVVNIHDASNDGSINWSLTSIPSWIKASTTWGRGTANVSLEIMQNASFTQNREAVIFIEAHGGNNWSTKIPVTITQNVQVRPIHNNHEYVDLGLPSGLKWATCNIGASAPEQIGNYYAWGETTTKGSYTESNYKYYTSAGYTKYTYWNEDCSGTPDKKSTLDLSDDAARQNWGGSWRMPTKAEMEELISKCTLTDTTVNGVGVLKITGPNGKYIIMPYNQFMLGTELSSSNPTFPWIWTSSHYQGSDYNSDAWTFFLGHMYRWIRYEGLPVRPVFK